MVSIKLTYNKVSFITRLDTQIKVSECATQLAKQANELLRLLECCNQIMLMEPLEHDLRTAVTSLMLFISSSKEFSTAKLHKRKKKVLASFSSVMDRMSPEQNLIRLHLEDNEAVIRSDKALGNLFWNRMKLKPSRFLREYVGNNCKRVQQFYFSLSSISPHPNKIALCHRNITLPEHKLDPDAKMPDYLRMYSIPKIPRSEYRKLKNKSRRCRNNIPNPSYPVLQRSNNYI